METNPKRNLTSLGLFNDGLIDTKKIDLVSIGKEPKLVYIIATNLRLEEKNKLTNLLLEF